MSTRTPTSSSWSSMASSRSRCAVPTTRGTVELQPRLYLAAPKGTEHKPSSPGGAILMFEPAGTLNIGDRQEGAIPDYVDTTTGRGLDG